MCFRYIIDLLVSVSKMFNLTGCPGLLEPSRVQPPHLERCSLKWHRLIHRLGSGDTPHLALILLAFFCENRSSYSLQPDKNCFAACWTCLQFILALPFA